MSVLTTTRRVSALGATAVAAILVLAAAAQWATFVLGASTRWQLSGALTWSLLAGVAWVIATVLRNGGD